MKTKFLLPVFAALPLFAVVSCAPSRQGPAMTVSSSDQSASAKLFNETNAYRASKGKSALTRHAGLDHLAQAHSEFLRRNRGKFHLEGHNVSHDGFESRAAIARAKYNIPTLHENVAAGPRGSSILSTWENSKVHNQAMLDQWTLTGVGVVVDSDGMIFATQLFGTPGSSHMMLQERFGGF